MSTSTALWEETRVAALLGTGRQPYTAPNAEHALGAALAGLRNRDSEEQLLGSVALFNLYRQAGQALPNDASGAPEMAAEESTPACSEAFASLLAMILAGSHRDVLPEALMLLRKAKKRVPEILLPEMLGLGAQQRNIRDKITAVIGARGRWLAALNPDWGYAAHPIGQEQLFDPASLAQAWETADKASRATILAGIRAQDANAARELLAGSFSMEGSEDRARFLTALIQGLSPADEPFLEQTLGDRSKEVRRAAANLLVRLPGSALSKRMVERALPWVRIRKKFIGQALEVDLPEKFDPAWARDGIEEKPPSTTLGERAWWLAQMAGAVAPRVWQEHLGESPERLVALAAGSDWADALLLGWGKASQIHDDPAWAEPIIRYWLRKQNRAAYPQEMIPTAEHLGPSGEPLILHFLREDKEPLHDAHPALFLLADYEQPWSDTFARTVIENVKARVAAGADKDKRIWQLQQSLRSFALRAPVHLAHELSRDWPKDQNQWYNWAGPIEDFSAKLHFRRDLYKEIQT